MFLKRHHIFVFSALCFGLACDQEKKPCTVAANDDGSALITCPGERTTYIPAAQAGAAGDKGAVGEACSATIDEAQGTITISCPGADPITVSDGETGPDGDKGPTGDAGVPGAPGDTGASCSAADNGNGTFTISCPGQDDIVVGNGDEGTTGSQGGTGADGEDCSVGDNQDGTITVTCGTEEQDYPIAICGNAVVEAGEQCDDGNDVEEDGCLSSCMEISWQNIGASYWSTYAATIAGSAASGSSAAPTATLLAGAHGGNNSYDPDNGRMWRGGVLVPSGEIIGIPYHADEMLFIEPESGGHRLVGDFDGEGSAKWSGGVYHPSGYVVAIPTTHAQVLLIDPINETSQFVGDTYVGDFKWAGGVLTPSGDVVAIPQTSDNLLVISYESGEWETQTYSLPAGITDGATLSANCPSGSFKWQGGVLAPNDKIYAIPSCTEEILVIDSHDYSMSLIDNVNTATLGPELHTDGFKWRGGVLAANGKIYGLPSNAHYVLEVDPVSEALALIDSGQTGGAKWSGGVLAPNGKIYGIPHHTNLLLEIAPGESSTSVTTHDFSGGTCGDGVCDLLGENKSSCNADCDNDEQRWLGGVLGLNGKIYTLPSLADNIAEFDPQANGTLPSFVPLSGYYNKY